MRSRNLFIALLAVSPLLAGGEYDRFHIGLRGGLAWSPDKGYGSLGSVAPGTSTRSEAGMQVAPTVGLQASFALVPGRFGVSLIGDLLRPIHKEATPVGENGAKVDQTIVRGECRFNYAFRGNTNEGTNVFLSVTRNQIHTSHDTLESLKEKATGGAVGISSSRFRETYTTYVEGALYYVPKLTSGTKAGGLSVELRVGWLF